ncbi:MAG TPA: Zn-dependent hydrolase [Bacteroidales bacterium]|nr:Zn-dependent hydrolase [Bacteroidales bacterium]HSA43120.1 Zn-dependent hydrolase [Bacteroidales bacterium]
MTPADSALNAKVNEFVEVSLTVDLSGLTENEKNMIPLLIDIADIMDDLFWQQTFPQRDSLLSALNESGSLQDSLLRQFVLINYGPWERLNGNRPFFPEFGEKPAGAAFYPADMSKEEFEAFDNKDKHSQYTLIRRKPDKSLHTLWYHEAYSEQLAKASALMKQAAALADDPGLKQYLSLRAEALVTDQYFDSDMAWMDMKTNTLDFVVGPIENYEDALFGIKTAYEAAVLFKDKAWSQKLEKFSALLPQLQKELPVDAKYKAEKPGSNSDLNAYDILYYAGQANEGAKTIAINLPNDEQVQLQKGSRRLQLKNAMKAKFDHILMPIAEKLIAGEQMQHVSFDAFFNNVMFHEVAHGLGIKNTITGKGPVRKALKETYAGFEEAKADILGLFLVTRLIDMGQITDIRAEDCYVTFLAGIFRSVRFGAASAHGKANMMCFNYFEDRQVFTRRDDGTYLVDMAKMKTAVNEWVAKVITTQGEGDYQAALDYLNANSVIRPGLQADLDQLKSAGIPVDVRFVQGKQVLGL